MRNLKKVLSLALALVLTLSLATVAMSASAATATATGTSAAFTDASSIKNTAAVNLLTSLGVLKGYEDGTYQPTKTVTRAEAAKIICYVLLGSDVAGTLANSTATTTFTDMDGAKWAAGYVQYCQTIGIINGYGDGTFGPSDTVTTYQLAKMLLCALGYGQGNEFVGTSWATNVAVQAAKLGIIAKGTLNVSCTRDMAALYAYNDLFVKQATYSKDTGKYTVGTATLAADSFNLGEATGTLAYSAKTATDAAYYYVTDATIGVLKVTGNAADIGRQISVWYTNTGTVTTPTYAAATAYATTDKVLTTVTDGSYLNAGTSAAVYTADASIAYYLNGTKVLSSAAALATTKGASVQLISTDTNNNDVETVLVTAKSVAVVSGDVQTATNSTTGEVTIYVPTNTGVLGNSSSFIAASGYAGLAKGDVVLYYTGADGVTYISKAITFSGYVSASGTASGVGYITVGGTNYNASALTGAFGAGLTGVSATFGSVTPATTTYNFYKDDAGYIVGSVATSSTAAAAYLVVTDIAFVAGSTGLNSTSDSVQANVVFADGTKATITVAAMDALNLASGGDISATATANTAYDNLWYTYTKNATTGAYTLTTAAATTALDTVANSDGLYLTSGVAKYDGSHIGNSATLFIVKTTSASGTVSYNVYTGIANVPTVSNGALTGSVVTANGVSAYVFVNAGTVVNANNVDKNVFVIAKNGTVLVGTAVYDVYTVIDNGTKTTLKVDQSVSLTAATMYDLTVTDGVVTASAVPSTTSYTGVSSVAGNVIATGSTGFTYDSSTVVSVISYDSTATPAAWVVGTVSASAISVDANDTV